MFRILILGTILLASNRCSFADDIRELQMQYLELRDVNYDFVENYRQYIQQRENGTLNRQKSIEFKQKHRQFLVRLPEVRNSFGMTFESDTILPVDASTIDPLNNTNAWFHKKFGINPLERASINQFFSDKPFVTNNPNGQVFTSLDANKKSVKLDLNTSPSPMSYSSFSPDSSDVFYKSAAMELKELDETITPVIDGINDEAKELGDSYTETESLKEAILNSGDDVPADVLALLDDESGLSRGSLSKNEALNRVNNKQITELNQKLDKFETEIRDIKRHISDFEQAVTDKLPPKKLLVMREGIQRHLASLHNLNGVLKIGNQLVNDLQGIIGEPSDRLPTLNERQAKSAEELLTQSDVFHRSSQTLGNPFRLMASNQLDDIFGELDPGNGQPELPKPGILPTYPTPVEVPPTETLPIDSSPDSLPVDSSPTPPSPDPLPVEPSPTPPSPDSLPVEPSPADSLPVDSSPDLFIDSSPTPDELPATPLTPDDSIIPAVEPEETPIIPTDSADNSSDAIELTPEETPIIPAEPDAADAADSAAEGLPPTASPDVAEITAPRIDENSTVSVSPIETPREASSDATKASEKNNTSNNEAREESANNSKDEGGGGKSKGENSGSGRGNLVDKLVTKFTSLFD